MPALEAEAGMVPGLTERAGALAAQLAAVTQQLQQVGDLQQTVDTFLLHQHRETHSGNTSSSGSDRTKSRSSSRHRRTNSSERDHNRARSTGSSTMLFVRKPHDKSGMVHITTREALRSGE